MKHQFGGFEEPQANFTRIPNAFLEAMSIIDTLGEMKVVYYILRHTWGFQDEVKRITLDEFQYGRKRKDGTRLDSGTGLSKPTIIDGLSRAEQHGFIEVEVDDRDAARVKKFYSLRMAGVKELYPRSKETLPRTEKETTERNSVTAHSPSVQQPADPEEDLEDLEYVDLDELEEVTRPKWQIPDTHEQEAFLSNCNAKWYKSGQKSKVKAILKAADAGDILGDRVYEECARAIKDIPDLDKRNLPPLPRSWLKWRFEHAVEHRWSVDGLIKAILNRDALMRHCEYHMKGKPTGRVENGKYVIEIPEGGPR